jgi:3-hydroxyacyl-CoA dehydrogenase
VSSRAGLPVERVVVVDGDVAGAGIAQVLAVAGYRVTLCGEAGELTAARVEVDAGRFGLLAAVDAGRIGSVERRAALERLVFSEDSAEATAAADLLIVTREDRAGVAPTPLGEIESILAPGAILACNSPGEPVTALAAGLQHPGRLVGWRWGWPPPVSKLAEIVRGPLTSTATIETVVAVARSIGKNPVVIGDAPEVRGYVTNRLWAAVQTEATRIVASGVAGEAEVDQLMVDCFGWPSGPFGRGGRPH